jgi:hypothetical protein
MPDIAGMSSGSTLQDTLTVDFQVSYIDAVMMQQNLSGTTPFNVGISKSPERNTCDELIEEVEELIDKVEEWYDILRYAGWSLEGIGAFLIIMAIAITIISEGSASSEATVLYNLGCIAIGIGGMGLLYAYAALEPARGKLQDLKNLLHDACMGQDIDVLKQALGGTAQIALGIVSAVTTGLGIIMTCVGIPSLAKAGAVDVIKTIGGVVSLGSGIAGEVLKGELSDGGIKPPAMTSGNQTNTTGGNTTVPTQNKTNTTNTSNTRQRPVQDLHVPESDYDLLWAPTFLA